jgi:histidinol-phosphate aminotransferase
VKSPLDNVKPQVRAIAAYTLAARRAAIKINQNENPYEIDLRAKERILAMARERPWGRYPDFDPQELLDRLAAFAGWRPDGVLAGNGSNELIEALLMVTVGAGTRVVIPEPTFTLYALLTKVLGGEAIRVGLGPDLEYDLDALLRAQEAHEPTLTIVCAPNNPTGGTLTPEQVERLCASSHGLVVIDEAYHEFSGQTMVPLLERHANLVVLRTFSKAMAMAGLRVGYLMASPELVREINKARLPYNLNFLSQEAAIAAIEEWPALKVVIDRLVVLGERLRAELAALPGVRVYPSRANFFLVELAEADPKAVFESVYRRGILIRDVTSYPRLGRCLRISVGSEEENRALVVALREALAEVKQAPAGGVTTGRATS